MIDQANWQGLHQGALVAVATKKESFFARNNPNKQMHLYIYTQVSCPGDENTFSSGFNVCESTKGKKQGFYLVVEILK